MMYLPWPKLLFYWAEEPTRSDWEITRTSATWEPNSRYADPLLDLSPFEFRYLYFGHWTEPEDRRFTGPTIT